MSSFEKQTKKAVKSHRTVADVMENFPKSFVILDNKDLNLNYCGLDEIELRHLFFNHFVNYPENFNPIRNAVVEFAVVKNPVLQVFDTLVNDALNNPKYKDMPNMDISEILNEIILNTENFEEKPPEFIASVIKDIKEKFDFNFIGIINPSEAPKPVIKKPLEIKKLDEKQWIRDIIQMNSDVIVSDEMINETMDKLKVKYNFDAMSIGLVKFKDSDAAETKEAARTEENNIPIQ